MREIKFRGKRVDNSEWVYGYYVKYEHMGTTKHIIITNWAQVYVNSFEVDAETVGQYTGLCDKNSRKIFEGDIIIECDYDKYVVEFSKDRGGWFPFATDDGCGCCSEKVAIPKYVEVIGNIYENKELLEVKSND